jgi:hypothetical protein
MFKVILTTSHDVQQSMLMLAMKSNACATMAKPLDVNPLTHIFSISKVLTYSFLEYFKFVKIVMVQVLGSMEDELFFIYLAFCKSKSCN